MISFFTFWQQITSVRWLLPHYKKILMGCLTLVSISWSELQSSDPLMAWGCTANRDTALIDVTIVLQPCVELGAFSYSVYSCVRQICAWEERWESVRFILGLGCRNPSQQGPPFCCQRSLSFMRRLARRAVSHSQTHELSSATNQTICCGVT